MWERMKDKRNEGGFTLIELLIVIIILAILAAIVVFAVGTSGSNAATAACNADAKSVESAVEAYKAANSTGNFPAPSVAWSAGANYQTNYTLLTTATGTPATGPWLRAAPGTQYYTIMFDNGGDVWVNKPGDYTTADSKTAGGNDFDAFPTICSTNAVA